MFYLFFTPGLAKKVAKGVQIVTQYLFVNKARYFLAPLAKCRRWVANWNKPTLEGGGALP